VLALAVIAGVGWWALRAHDPTAFAGGTRVAVADYHAGHPTGVPPTLAGADAMARGEYLARAADCVACHTAPGGKPFAGGLAFKLPVGTLYSPNLTPDRETGIGAWSDADFVKAMHEGIGKDGEFLYPAFPYTAYTLMTRDDVLAIKAYLFSLAPIHNSPPEDDMKFPFNQRYLMFFWDRLFNTEQRFRPNADQTPAWNRGAYLVEALGHCGECHTPRNLLYARSGRKFAGAVLTGWKAYNVTSDTQSGVGAWSDEELAAFLSTGHAPGHSSASGPMADVLDNSLRFLTPDDIRAMVAYLKTIPPIPDKAEPAVARKPPPTTIVAAAGTGGDRGHLGLFVFEGACASCHRWDGSGAQSSYAALLGSRTVNDPAAINLTQVVLHGSRLQTKHGEEFMPAFGNAYSDVEIAAVANYVTGRFGARAATVAPDQVAKRRQE
jgi:mono/diheme cytochrome c family protein